MNVPSLLFGLMIATLIGAAFHFWRGGNLGRLILYVILSWVGFWLGHILADSMGWTFGSVGPLRLLFACVGAVIVVGVGYWLSLVRK